VTKHFLLASINEKGSKTIRKKTWFSNKECSLFLPFLMEAETLSQWQELTMNYPNVENWPLEMKITFREIIMTLQNNKNNNDTCPKLLCDLIILEPFCLSLFHNVESIELHSDCAETMLFGDMFAKLLQKFLSKIKPKSLRKITFSGNFTINHNGNHPTLKCRTIVNICRNALNALKLVTLNSAKELSLRCKNYKSHHRILKYKYCLDFLFWFGLL